MMEHKLMKHDTLSVTRQINAPRELVYEAWTKLEHRKHWFAGPAWTEIARSIDLKLDGKEDCSRPIRKRYGDNLHRAFSPYRTECATDLYV